MEVYLVKNEVKIIPVREAFSKSRVNLSGVGAFSESQDEDDQTLLTVSDLPVVLRSICSGADASQHSEQFAERVGSSLLDLGEKDFFQNIKLELVIKDEVDKDANSLNGYFVLSSISPAESIKLNIINRMYRDLWNAELKFMIEVSLCRLPIVDAAVYPESLISLKVDKNCCSFFRRDPGQMCMRIGVGIPVEVKELWEQGTGVIYSKSSVKVTLSEDAVNWAYHCSTVNEGLLYSSFTDLEIECETGEIFRCHRALLGKESDVLWRKLEEMMKRKKNGPWKLKMEMSSEAVWGLLEYIYCDKVGVGVRRCDLALELLKAGRQYDIWGLPRAMEEIIMAKDSSDLKYFSVENASELFLYSRKNGKDMKHLMDKATRVLHNFSETATDEKVGSDEYQTLFEDEQPFNSFRWRAGLQEMWPILMVVLFAGVKIWRGIKIN